MKKRGECSITQFFYLNLRTLIFIRKMKQLKFLMVAFTLLMGVSLTSCLNSDNDYAPSVGGLVKVSDSMFGNSFTMLDGVTKISPTAASLATLESNMGFKPSSTNIAYVTGTYDETLNSNLIEDKEYKSVNLLWAVSLDAKVEITERGAENDSVNKAPVIDIDNSSQMEYEMEKKLHKPWFFYDKTTLILPINYFVYKAGAHKFTLVYYPEENADGNKTLKLYLKHYDADDKSTNTNSLNNSGAYPQIYYYAYDLRGVFSQYSKMTGEMPTTVTVEYVTNANSLKLEDAETKTCEVEVKGINESTTDK